MLTTGTILQNRYSILNLIAEGGMGAVYLARDQCLHCNVALKQTFFTDDALLKAFEREALLLAGLHHPALPRVNDYFAEGSGQFLVMQYIPGDDLDTVLKQQGTAFPPDDVLLWAYQLLDTIDYLHAHEPPIIHRDIKPQNLKLTKRGQIVLLDFGLAKGAASYLTHASIGKSVFGFTPAYAPPEQIEGAGTDPRSDIYSLGATLYHLITAVIPASAFTRATAILGGQLDPLRPANEVNPYVSPDVTNVLMQAMALNRDYRYATANKMRQALQATPLVTVHNSLGISVRAEELITESPKQQIESVIQDTSKIEITGEGLESLQNELRKLDKMKEALSSYRQALIPSFFVLCFSCLVLIILTTIFAVISVSRPPTDPLLSLILTILIAGLGLLAVRLGVYIKDAIKQQNTLKNRLKVVEMKKGRVLRKLNRIKKY